MFCLARKVLDGVSITFLIADFFDFPFTITFAILLRKETSFVVLPLPLSSFVFRYPIFTILAWPCLPVSFFFFGLLYLAPDVFLPDFIEAKENFGLNRFLCKLLGTDILFYDDNFLATTILFVYRGGNRLVVLHFLC